MDTQLSHKLTRGLVYALTFLPLLVYTGFVFPYVFTKVIFFEAAGLCLLVLLARIILKGKFFWPRKHYLLYGWLAFVAVMFLAALGGRNFYRSFWSNFERMEGLIVYLFLAIYFLAVSVALRKSENWRLFFRLNIFVGLAASVYGFLQKLFPDGLYLLPTAGSRLESAFGNAAFLASYLLFIIYLCLILFWRDKNKSWRIFYCSAFVVNLLALFLTETRGAFLGLFFGLIVWLVVMLLRPEGKKKAWLGAALVLMVLLPTLSFLARNNVYLNKIPVFERLSHISWEDSSVRSRLFTWRSAWQSFKERPLLGYGPENQKYGFNKYFNPDIYEQWFDRAHNIVFDLLTAGGILALAVYLGIFVVAAAWLYRISRKDFVLAAILFSLLAAYFFQNLFVFDTIMSFILFLSILAYIGYLRFQGEGSEERRLKFRGRGLVFSVAAIAAALAFFIVILTPAQASYYAAQGEKLFPRDKDSAYENYERSLAINTYGQSKIAIGLAEQLYAYLNSGEEIDRPAAVKFFGLARENLKKALVREPDDAQLILISALVEQSYADIDNQYLDEAISLVADNIALSPNRPEMYTSLAQSYLLKGGWERALEYLWQAQEISPQRSRYLKMAAIYSAGGGDAAGLSVIYESYRRDFPEIRPAELKQMANYFFQAGFYTEAIPITELIVEAEPADPNNYISLAVVYSRAGETEKAREAIKKILDINPAYGPQVEEFLRTLK